MIFLNFNIGSTFFRFVTKHAYEGQTDTDRQIDSQNYDPQDRANKAASSGKKPFYFCNIIILSLQEILQ